MQSLNSRCRCESRQGGVIFRFLLVCVVLVFAASLVGIQVMRNVARNVHLRTATRNGGDDVALETPAGSFRIRAHEHLDPAAIGVPIYPGARRTDSSGGAEFEWVSSDGLQDRNLSVAGASFITPDPLDNVVEFYRSQLSSLVVIHQRNRKARLEYTHDGLRRIIGISEQNDGTHIGVAAIGGAASN